MKNHLLAALVSLPGLLVFPCHAELLPLWEAGAGFSASDVPDFHGEDERSRYYLPLSYFAYRSEFLEAGREGMRTPLFVSERMQVNLSLKAALPVGGDNNFFRRGVPGLTPTAKFGPTFDLTLWHSPERKIQLDFRAPLRAAIALQTAPGHIGWLFSPNLNLKVRDFAGLPGWKFGMQAGPLFADRRYNSYFYGVDARDAAAGRPRYTAPGGYAGTQATLTISKRFPRFWAGAFLRYDNLGAAAFTDSPLLQRRSALAGGVAAAWVFGASSTPADAPQ